MIDKCPYCLSDKLMVARAEWVLGIKCFGCGKVLRMNKTKLRKFVCSKHGEVESFEPVKEE